MDTFEQTDWIAVIQSEDVFSDDAPDRQISEYAARERWVVFTEDDDFLAFEYDRGLVLYNHINQPSKLRYVVNRSTVCRDMKRLRESVDETLGDDAKLTGGQSSSGHCLISGKPTTGTRRRRL